MWPTIFKSFLACSIACRLVNGHGETAHHQKPLEVPPGADWTTRHMIEEHHITIFDADSFFTLHDYDNNGVWDRYEITRTYGLDQPVDSPYAFHVPHYRIDEIVDDVMKIMDENNDHRVSREEWTKSWNAGKGLPDEGTGPGHHGDDEYEYEIHHWEKYHDENTKEEDLTHPEDIQHFKHHEEEEDAAAEQAERDKYEILEQNIPPMFKRY